MCCLEQDQSAHALAFSLSQKFIYKRVRGIWSSFPFTQSLLVLFASVNLQLAVARTHDKQTPCKHFNLESHLSKFLLIKFFNLTAIQFDVC